MNAGPPWDGTLGLSGRVTLCLLSLSVYSAAAGLAGFGCLWTLLEGLDECGQARVYRVGDAWLPAPSGGVDAGALAGERADQNVALVGCEPGEFGDVAGG